MKIGITGGPIAEYIGNHQYEIRAFGIEEEVHVAFDPALIGKPKTLPIAITVYGEPKAGKTRLFSEFSGGNTVNPDTMLMLWENPGPTISGREDISTTQKFTKYEDGMAFLKWLYDDPGYIKVLGVDTITAMYTAFEIEVAMENNVASIAEIGGGFGKGVAMVKNRIGKMIRAFEALRERHGIKLIYLAHDDIRTFKRPDGESYNFYGMNMNEDCYMLFVNNSDVIAYLDQKTISNEAKDKHVIVKGTGERYLRVKYSPAYVSGNRYGIEDDIKYTKGTNPFAPWIDASRGPAINIKSEIKE